MFQPTTQALFATSTARSGIWYYQVASCFYAVPRPAAQHLDKRAGNLAQTYVLPCSMGMVEFCGMKVQIYGYHNLLHHNG